MQPSDITDSMGSPHTFHIPVMGTGFTIDTPLKVARYGISSVVSIGDDILMEQMRQHHSERLGLEFEPIGPLEDDSRARRITAYLNLLHDQVNDQIESVRKSAFEPGSEITRYFELLPESPLRQAYREMMRTKNETVRNTLADQLRQRVVPGSIDVNIMTKIDRDRYRKGVKLPPEEAVAMSALRGFASSRLRSSVVLSAGMNRRLFAYIAEFDDFFADAAGLLKKKITIKVSDFRSAIVQGKMLASRGLWVSEYRIESGLNCGGHAFASKGALMGPIMEEFKKKRPQLTQEHFDTYQKALANLEKPAIDHPPHIRITVQGGIGTAGEDRFLSGYFEVDSTGWGTPFLLVPEVTNVDDDHLKKLAAATSKDVYLSKSSPLGVPFWNLRNSKSEDIRSQRIAEGRPGSPCPKGFLAIKTQYSDQPLCHASRAFQRKRLIDVEAGDHAAGHEQTVRETVLAKACLCMDLAAGALLKAKVVTDANTAICCGPAIENYSEITTLDKMVDHIYGRLSLLINSERPHMFIKELRLYLDYLAQEIDESSQGLLERTSKYFAEFKENLVTGIEYYQDIADQFGKKQRVRFLEELDALYAELEKLLPETVAVATA